jgi:hypothetical protein
MYEPVYGYHVGLVVNDQDPEHRSRLQIFIPHISNTLYSDWNERVAQENVEDINFRTFETGIFSESMKKRLMDVLPWAEAAAPIFGGGTSGHVSASTGKASTVIESSIDDSSGDSTSPSRADSISSSKGESTSPLTNNERADPAEATRVSDRANVSADASSDTLPVGVSVNDDSNTPIRTIVAETTKYSFGSKVGGPDDYNDSGTNSGKGNYGRVVLGPGAAAASASTGVSNGTILRNSTTKELVMIVDTSPQPNPNIDVWRDPSLYASGRSINGDTWEIIGKTQDMPQNNSELQSILSVFDGVIPDGLSAEEYLAEGTQAIADATRTGKMMASGSNGSDGKSIPVRRQYGGTRALPSTHEKGYYSKPVVGAKVWVFFYGGDIQRPVYFASVLESNSVAAANQPLS